MLKIMVLVCGVAGALGATIPEETVPQLDGRIVGGYETTIDKFPWQVAVLSGPYICGGSIYSSTIIITAAHCMTSETLSDYVVRAGSSFRSSGGEVRSIDAFAIHPEYDDTTIAADCAVLHLTAALTLGTANIQSIPLPTSPPAHGAGAKVSGWGVIGSDASCCPGQLRAVNFKIVSFANCRSSDYGYGSQVRAGMICAMGPGKDSCGGDSGGPLVSGGVLVGIVSWGVGCASEYYPGVYTSVSYYRSWLTSTANRLSQ